MNTFFINLLFGHLIGDYLLQNKWMAMNKSGSTWKCVVHCLIYTCAITALTWTNIHNWYWSVFVFASHFPIDRWSLADKWLDLINGRSMKDFVWNGHENIPNLIKEDEYKSHNEYGNRKLNYQILRGGFTAFVYAIVDNTFHLLIMYYGKELIWG